MSGRCPAPPRRKEIIRSDCGKSEGVGHPSLRDLISVEPKSSSASPSRTVTSTDGVAAWAGGKEGDPGGLMEDVISISSHVRRRLVFGREGMAAVA